MTLEAEIVTELERNSDLQALIHGRIYPMLLPQNPELPAVTYSRISTTPLYCQEGNAQLVRQRLQFSCWAMSHQEAATVAAAVRRALEGRVVGVAFADNEIDFYEPETGYYHRALDMIIWSQEE